jgi:hypothetical protein
MTFLAPWALWAAGAVSAAVIALHILASKNPRVTALPTTRFIPDVPLRATARALRLSDVLLMVLRVAVVMLAGVALARPELTRARRAVGRVVMVDRGSYDRENSRAGDSARSYLSSGDVLIEFDSAAHTVAVDKVSTALSSGRSSSAPRGSLSVAFAAGMRAASRLRGDADSVELVLISPFANEEWDAATRAIRAAWPGRLRLVRIAGMDSGFAPVSIDVRGATLDDPVRATVGLLARADTLKTKARFVRLDRGAPNAADTSWAKLGAAYVRWPASLDSSGWRARARTDTIGAVFAGEGAGSATVVATFARRVDAPAGRVIARWADGSAAATQRALGDGCVRDVAIPLPRAGDLALRESTRRLVTALTTPCGGIANAALAPDSALVSLRGAGPLVATRALDARTASPSRLATWLLVAALALLLVEPLLRRQRVAA